MSNSNLPEFLVMGQDGNLAAYGREDVLRCDLAVHRRDGDPARGVWKLNRARLQVVYEPAAEFAEFVAPLQNLCDRHKRLALPRETTAICAECEKEAGR